MKNMIKADFYRIIHSKRIYAALALMLLFLFLSIYLISPGTLGLANTATVDNQLTGYSYEEYYSLSFHELRQLRLKLQNYALDRDILASNINLYYLFLFVAALVVTCDLSSKSVKNTLTSAVSREQYFFYKCITTSIFCILILFLNTYLAYFGNRIFNSRALSSGFWEVTAASLLQIPAVIALSTVLCGLAFLLKKSVLYHIVTIPLVYVFQLVLAIAAQLFRIRGSILNYEFQVMLAQLARKPDVDYVLCSYFVCALVTALFGFAGYRSFLKMELK